MPQAEAFEGGFLRDLDEDEKKRFTALAVHGCCGTQVYNSTSWYKLVCTSTYQYILLHTSIYRYVQTSTYLYIQVCTCMVHMVQTSTYLYIQVCTCNVYEVNYWLWMFGRGKPRLGGLSVAETAVRKSARHEDQVKRAVETRRRRKAAKASSK